MSGSLRKFTPSEPAIPISKEQDDAVSHFVKMVREAKYKAEINGQREMIEELTQVSREMLGMFPRQCTCNDIAGAGKSYLCQCCQRVLKVGEIANKLEANSIKTMHEEIEVVKMAMSKIIEMQYRSENFDAIEDRVMSSVVAKLNPSKSD